MKANELSESSKKLCKSYCFIYTRFLLLLFHITLLSPVRPTDIPGARLLYVKSGRNIPDTVLVCVQVMVCRDQVVRALGLYSLCF